MPRGNDWGNMLQGNGPSLSKMANGPKMINLVDTIFHGWVDGLQCQQKLLETRINGNNPGIPLIFTCNFCPVYFSYALWDPFFMDSQFCTPIKNRRGYATSVLGV